jgi:glutamate-1-semialdehyde 2,1-aminomutase
MQALYDGLDERWGRRLARMNDAMAAANLPVRVAGLSSIWTILYNEPSRYNWMFQFYLRRHGLGLSWVGSGRLIFSLNYDDVQFDEVVRRFVAAGLAMREGGWWHAQAGASNRQIRRSVLREMMARRFFGRA